MTTTGQPLGTPADVIARLVHARITAGLSQRQLARQIGTSNGAISNVENGKRSPCLDTLTRYAAGVGHIIAVIPTPQEKP